MGLERVGMPSVSELRRIIYESQSSDWKFIDAPPEYIYKPEPDLRLEEKDYGEDVRLHDENSFYEPWLDNFHHEHDVFQRRFWLYWGSSRIDYVDVLWIDEGRCELPLPVRTPSESPPEGPEDYEEIYISSFDAAIGRAMSGGDFDHYLNVGNIEVRDENEV